MTIEPSHAPRYAIYFAPESDSPWWRLGAGLLGRNEGCGVPPPHTAPPRGIDPDRWHRMTAEARRYGFHATLKAPFRLDTRASLPMLTERVSALAATLRTIPLGPLDPKPFPGFVALAPATSPQGLAELAARCVVELDDLRAPALAADLARRQPDRLDARGLELLHAYGYPHVLERFRFHMTVANCAQADLVQRLIEALLPLTAALNRDAPLHLDRLCLFEEAAPGADLRRVRDWALAR